MAVNLYSLIFVLFFRWLVFQAHLHSLPKVLFALAGLLSISLSMLVSDEMVQPK